MDADETGAAEGEHVDSGSTTTSTQTHADETAGVRKSESSLEMSESLLCALISAIIVALCLVVYAKWRRSKTTKQIHEVVHMAPAPPDKESMSDAAANAQVYSQREDGGFTKEDLNVTQGGDEEPLTVEGGRDVTQGTTRDAGDV